MHTYCILQHLLHVIWAEEAHDNDLLPFYDILHDYSPKKRFYLQLSLHTLYLFSLESLAL